MNMFTIQSIIRIEKKVEKDFRSFSEKVIKMKIVFHWIDREHNSSEMIQLIQHYIQSLSFKYRMDLRFEQHSLWKFISSQKFKIWQNLSVCLSLQLNGIQLKKRMNNFDIFFSKELNKFIFIKSNCSIFNWSKTWNNPSESKVIFEKWRSNE
jgi:hypothetical protein